MNVMNDLLLFDDLDIFLSLSAYAVNVGLCDVGEVIQIMYTAHGY